MSRFVIHLLLLMIFSCQKPFSTDDEMPASGDTGMAVWERIDFESERPLLNIFATPFQLYAITENQFFRFNDAHEIVEKRILSTANGVKGIPVLTDNLFTRLTTTNDEEQTLEFHLARNAAEIIKINAEDLKDSMDNHLEIEFLARQLGAFNQSGTQFLLPVKIFSNLNNHYAFFLFDIQLNQGHDEFVSVEVAHRIDIPQIGADFANVASIRFIEDNFYVASKQGAYRITETGGVTRVFPQWMLDFFLWEEYIYVIGLNTFDMHRSADGGLTWEKLDQNSDFRMIEVAGDHIFTHQVRGHVYQLGHENLQKIESIRYPTEVDPSNLSAFYGVDFYNNHYYFSVDRTIYFTNEIKLE